jgi:outer membrane murein-binding lipoprotein Lpp
MKGTLLGAAGVVLALFGLQFYGMHTTKVSMEARMDEMQSKIQSLQDDETSRIAELATNVNAANERIGVTSQDIIQQTQKTATALKQEQTKTVADLHSQLKNQSEEHAKAVDALRQESGAKIDEVNTQIGAVNGDVKAVNGQVDGVKTDLAATKNDLAANRKDLNDVRDSLGRQIAHNEDELSILKRRGERNYTEFNIAKSNTMQRVGDIQLQLTKADPKAQRYDIALLASDAKYAKKGQIINEPVQLLIGQNHVRYELVVNSVEKDRIRGYLSAPKDAVLSAEGPTSR